MTFSLLARDPETGDLGVAVASRWPGVGGAVPYFRAGVGLVASQSVADAAIAEAILDAMAKGNDPATAIPAGIAGRKPEIRQILALSHDGRTAAVTGASCVPETAHHGRGACIAAGNMLTGADVPVQMIAAFMDGVDLAFADRLIAALAAGDDAGGDRRGREAACIHIWPRDHPDL